MKETQRAIEQIGEIRMILEERMSAVVSGERLLRVGITVMAIPLIEALLSAYLDPLWSTAPHAYAITFIQRTIMYSTLFTLLGPSRGLSTELRHPIVARIFRVTPAVAYGMVALAAVMALCGYAKLIAPIVLIAGAIQLFVVGQFAPVPLLVASGCCFVVGLTGVYLTLFDIPHLWRYLVVTQGLIMTLAGLALMWRPWR